jgi:hypothetical protein
VADSPSLTKHLFQAALRYLEHGDVQGLRAVLLTDPALARAGEQGRGEVRIRIAIETGRLEMLEALLDAGVDPNVAEGERIQDGDRVLYQPGYVPLHYAARAGRKDMVDLLIARGAAPDAEDYCGGTPLHAARTAEIAEALLIAGANPNADCWLRHFDETLDWHFVASPLHVTAQAGDVSMIRVLVSHGANVDSTDGITGRTPLYYAAARGQVEAVKGLLEFGADPNVLSTESRYGYGRTFRYTALHRAAQNGHEKVVVALLKQGADSNIKAEPHGKTASELASDKGYRRIAAILNAAATKKRRPANQTKKRQRRTKM